MVPSSSVPRITYPSRYSIDLSFDMRRPFFTAVVRSLNDGESVYGDCRVMLSVLGVEVRRWMVIPEHGNNDFVEG